MDFQKIVTELLGTGLSQAEIGRRVGATQGAVSFIARGVTQTPTLPVAMGLMELHKKVMKGRRAAKK